MLGARTLAELCDAMPTTAAASCVRTVDALLADRESASARCGAVQVRLAARFTFTGHCRLCERCCGDVMRVRRILSHFLLHQCLLL
jgi:hypothetical protein